MDSEKRLEDLHEQLRPVMDRFFKTSRDPQETEEQAEKRRAYTASIFNAARILAAEERMGHPLPPEWWTQITPKDNERMAEILRDCLGLLVEFDA